MTSRLVHVAAAWAALSLVADPRPMAAQTPGAATPAPSVHGAPPGALRTVRGRVVRGGAAVARPMAGAWVVLHRVGSDHAAPLDSMRTDEHGAYAFSYRTSGDPRAVYFVSSAFGGIAYFTAPLQAAMVRGDDAELVVHDTTSAPVPIRVRARHIVLSAPDAKASRRVVEVFELSNDSSVTRVAAGDTGLVWQSAMIDGARNAAVGSSDFSVNAVRFVGGRVRLAAPFAPGLKQFSYAYEVPAGTEYRLAVAAPADLVEVLIEDGLGRAEGGGIIAAGPTTVSGRTFVRFLGQDVPANAVLTLHAPTQGAASGNQLRMLAIVAALGAVLLVGLARVMMRRSPTSRRAAAPMDAAALRARLAALDEVFANIDTPTPVQRADHYEARARLAQQITDAVAREQGLS